MPTVGLTSDLWTFKQNVGYISVTVLYIDNDWIMQKRMILFSLLEFPHIGAKIGFTVLEKIRQYNIENEIISIL